MKSDHVSMFCNNDLTTDSVRKYRYSCATDKREIQLSDFTSGGRQTIAVCIDSKTVLKGWKFLRVATDHLKFYPFPNKDCTLTS